MAQRRKGKSKRPHQVKRIVKKLPAGYFEVFPAANILFPALYQFENGLRVLLNSYLTTCYGANWWDVSLKPKLQDVFNYADAQQKKLNAMSWLGTSTAVSVLPIHLVTLGHLEEVVKAYRSDCIPQLFPTIEFFLGHMEVIKRVRNMYSHMFPCLSKADSKIAMNEIEVLAMHINSRL
jgi:hypothetical protein